MIGALVQLQWFTSAGRGRISTELGEAHQCDEVVTGCLNRSCVEAGCPAVRIDKQVCASISPYIGMTILACTRVHAADERQRATNQTDIAPYCAVHL